MHAQIICKEGTVKIFHFFQILTNIPLRIMYPTKFIGKKHIPKGPCIIASNHKSNLDAIILATHTWEKKFYLAKKELFEKKAKGGFVKGIGGIKIDRQANDVGAIKECLKVLKNGKKLVIFPEGTRTNNEDQSLGQVKQGVAMFAIKGKVPIVPMFIMKKPKIFRRNKVFFGEPFALEEFYDKKLTAEELEKATEIVANKLNELKDFALNSLTKKK